MKLRIIQFKSREDGPSLELIPENETETELMALFRMYPIRRAYDGRLIIHWYDKTKEAKE